MTQFTNNMHGATGIAIRTIVLFTSVAIVANGEVLVCERSDTESDNETGLSTATAERVTALEAKVRQLQNVISTGNFNKRAQYGELPRDCAEIYANGTRQSGVYVVSPDGRCPFKVYCNMTDDGWTVIDRRVFDPIRVSFFRKWGEYVEGFGYLDGSHWLGLDKIHRLTRQGSEIKFELENYDGSTDFAHYLSFIVNDVTTAYTMKVDPFGYTGSIKDLFSYHNGQKFSTYERDNDKYKYNCAENSDGGGWWYNACTRLGNINGVLDRQTGGGLNYNDGARTVYVKTATIKVRPRAGMCSTLSESDQLVN